jgi:hypothetical protein
VLSLGFFLPNINLDPSASFTRAPSPGPSNVTLEAGKTDVWLEYPQFGAVLTDGSDVRLVDPRSGDEIPIRPTTDTEILTRDGLNVERIGSVAIPEAGVYRVSTSNPEVLRISFGTADQSGQLFALALGGMLFLALALFGTGVPLLIVGIVQFANTKNQSQR